MRYRLRDHLAHCQLDGAIVLLDLAADRYFQMSGSSAAALTDILAHGASAPRRAHLDHFLRTGLLIVDPASRASARASAITAPARDVLASGMPPVALWRVLSAVVAHRHAARALRRRPLLDIVTSIAGEAWPDPPLNEADALERARPIAAAFARSSYVMPVAEACLARSLALIRACHRVDVRPRLVFGVSIAPFAAHAWAQFGEWVLTGDLDEVRQYTPILAIP